MKKITLSMAISSNPRTWPMLDGTVKPDGIELITTVLQPSEMFWRQLKYSEFDISEMSMSSLLIAISKGDDRWIGLPVFTTRRFFHTSILVRKDAGIESPPDLKGKRVGVPEYQQTGALWSRGILKHEFGVEPGDMEFWMERTPDISHGAATGFRPPPGVTIHQIPAEKDIGSMMLSGELDATLLYLRRTNLVDRATADLCNHPDIRYLFPDPRAEGARYFSKTGIYPINHGMVVRRRIFEEHSWVVLNLLKAFEKANEVADQRRIAHVEYYLDTGLLPPDAEKSLKIPLVQHGIRSNRKTLETLARYSFEQGLTRELVRLEEVFAPNTLER
ncbi:MAG: ABC transporter substrate-binding protein [Deltaproteobacteria bacterium]|nr:ABC transporter substrate-binding protein [Deltaproteobacteria bacterium]